jgi:dUTP pyrophosphatase
MYKANFEGKIGLPQVGFKPLFGDVKEPQYATEGSAGFDLIAHNFKKYTTHGITTELVDVSGIGLESLVIHPGHRALIGLGFAMEIPNGMEMQIRPRSGNALKKGLTVLNTPGTIDSDYRLEVGVILINHSPNTIEITKGDAIAQGVMAYVPKVGFRTVDTLSETTRTGGFGSTDKQ